MSNNYKSLDSQVLSPKEEELDFEDQHKPVLHTWEPVEWQGRQPAEISWSTTLTAGIGALMVILSVWIYFSN